MFRLKKNLMVLLVAMICMGFTSTLHASYWGWRFNSLWTETAESSAREEAEEKARIEAEERAREEAEEKAAAEKRRKTYAEIGSAILWYLPNRLGDLLECFTFEVGIGDIGVDLSLTRYATFGAGVGYAYMTGFGFNDQNGLYRQRYWNADFLNLRLGEIDRRNICGDYQNLRQRYKGEINIDEMKFKAIEDPYAVGVKASCYVGVNFQLHPVEFLDFLAGWFFIDFKDDDRE